jgi:hypothetical protein
MTTSFTVHSNLTVLNVNGNPSSTGIIIQFNLIKYKNVNVIEFVLISFFKLEKNTMSFLYIFLTMCHSFRNVCMILTQSN